MSLHERTVIICYDIVRDKSRAKIARLLEKHMARVQESVFEARMNVNLAHGLFDKARLLCGNEDKLRLYILDSESLSKCRVQGGAPIADSSSYWLL